MTTWNPPAPRTGWQASESASANESAHEPAQVRYYHCDQIGTPRELTASDGHITWQATYRAWGNTQTVQWEAPPHLDAHRAAANAATWHDEQPDRSELQPLRFQGQYFDVETGLHYNRFRYYDPGAGRFVSQDPIGLWGGTNTSSYAPNSTVWSDPFGLACDPRKATHITYVGIKEGKPYVGYASMPGRQPALIVLRYRYGNDFSGFSGGAPDIIYSGYGQAGKDTARGLEQRTFERLGGLNLTANKQNPVGLHNKRRREYLRAADHQICACKYIDQNKPCDE
jgi:RHS repeat-associated protein